MVSRDSAAAYGRDRHRAHVRRFDALVDHVEGRGPHPGASVDGALASHLDARILVGTVHPA